MQSIGIAAVLDDRNFQQGLSRFNAGLNQMESGASKTANVLTSLGTVAQGALVVGIGAATAAFGAFVAASKIGLDTAMQYAETLDDLGNQFGLSGETAAKWTQTFNHVGLSVEEGAQGLNFFTRGLAETFKVNDKGVKTLTPFGEALQKIGVRAYDAKGKLKTFDQVLPDIMDAFKKMPNGINKTNLAMQLFGGRGGSKFLEFLSQGKEGLKDAEALVKEFGLSISSDGVEAIDDFGKSLNDMNAKMRGMWVQIGVNVLPVVKRMVDYFSANVLPVLNKFVQDNLPKLVAGFDRFVIFMQTNVLPLLDRFRKAFDKGGIGGIIDQLGIELGNAFKGFDAAKILGNLGAALSTAWSTQIQPALAKWGGQFWNWLTGKGGAIEQVSAQLGKVATEIQAWVSKNAPDWIKTFEVWKTSFWNWLTDKRGGVIATISQEFLTLTENIRLWSESPEAQQAFISIGKEIAVTIIRGIAGLFGEDPTYGGENVFTILARSLTRGALNIGQTLRNIGAGIAQGVLEGIAVGFYNKTDAEAKDAATAILRFVQRVIDFLGTGIRDIFWNKFNADFNDVMRLFGGGGTTGTTGTGGIGGGGGTTDRVAISGVAGGTSSLSQPVITNSNTTARNVSVSFAPGSLSFSGSSASDIETIAQTIANKTVAAVLGVA